MSTSDQITEPELADVDPEPRIAFALSLSEAEALRAWLLKSTVNGTSCLDDPPVNHVLTGLAHLLDTIHATENVRRELEQAGLDVAHLSDEQVRDLARRVAEAAQPSLGA